MALLLASLLCGSHCARPKRDSWRPIRDFKDMVTLVPFDFYEDHLGYNIGNRSETPQLKARCPIRKLLQLSKKQFEGVYTRVEAVSLKRRDWKDFSEIRWPESNEELWQIEDGYRFIHSLSIDRCDL